MKKLTLGFCALVALSSAAFAGTEMTTESKAVVPPPCPQWYADNEFNLSLSGIYAFSGNDEHLPRPWLGWGVSTQSTSSTATSVSVCRAFCLTPIRMTMTTSSSSVVMMVMEMALVVSSAPSPSGSRATARALPRIFGSVAAGSGVAMTMTSFSMPQAQLSAADGDDNDGHAMGQVGGGFEVRFTPHCRLAERFQLEYRLGFEQQLRDVPHRPQLRVLNNAV